MTNMSIFDKLKEIGAIVRALVDSAGVVRETGGIVKCFDEPVNGLLVGDELHQLLVNEDFEKYCELSESERSELLVHILRRLCVGGGLCQYDDDVDNYAEATKLLYKDLVRCVRGGRGGCLCITA
jgi:cilia- and flagella-associated protein 300